jgi:hypothetical protein
MPGFPRIDVVPRSTYWIPLLAAMQNPTIRFGPGCGIQAMLDRRCSKREKTGASSRRESASQRRILAQLTESVRPDWEPHDRLASMMGARAGGFKIWRLEKLKRRQLT